MTSRSQGQSQGHQGHFRFLPVLHVSLMSFDSHHIHTIGRYRQGQHTLMTSRSQGQSQGHEGYFRFFADLVIYAH